MEQCIKPAEESEFGSERLNNPHIPYEEVVNTVYMDLARKRDLPGSLDAKDFNNFMLEGYPNESERNAVHCTLGMEFDGAIVDLLSFLVIVKRSGLTINVPEDAGIGDDRALPWEESLRARLSLLSEQGVINEGWRCVINRQPVTEAYSAQAYDENFATAAA